MRRWTVTLSDGGTVKVVADDKDGAVLAAGDFFGQDVGHLVVEVEEV